MFIATETYYGEQPISILLNDATWNRLKDTCFRGTNKALAGNFSKWHNHNEMFCKPENFIREQLLADADEAIKKHTRTNSFSIHFGEYIGWSSTENRGQHSAMWLEQFNINKRATGYRVKTDWQNILAPKTMILTIIYEVKYEDDQIVLIIRSMYPGPDIGELIGDVSALENIVFFDWNHPGEP
jgi:hypothetical protein